MDRRTFLRAAVAAPLALTLAPRAAAGGGGGRTLALATADLDARVVAVDPASGRVVARIITPPDPRSIETLGLACTALAACTASGVVVVIDAARREVRHELEGFAEPRYAARARDPRLAYVTDSGRGEVVVVDAARGRVLRRLDVGGPARHLGVDPSLRRLWVSLGNQAAAVAVVDVDEPARPRLVRRFAPVDRAHDVVFGADGAEVWVTSGTEHAVAIHDARTLRPLRVLAAGDPPQHVAVVPGGGVHVTSGDDGTLHVHDPARGRLRRAVRVPVGSFNVSTDGTWVVAPSLTRGTLAILDAGGTRRRTLRIGRAAHDACLVAVP